jgi:hypothetical protein
MDIDLTRIVEPYLDPWWMTSSPEITNPDLFPDVPIHQENCFCIQAALSDSGMSWDTPGHPKHPGPYATLDRPKARLVFFPALRAINFEQVTLGNPEIS